MMVFTALRKIILCQMKIIYRVAEIIVIAVEIICRLAEIIHLQQKSFTE